MFIQINLDKSEVTIHLPQYGSSVLFQGIMEGQMGTEVHKMAVAIRNALANL